MGSDESRNRRRVALGTRLDAFQQEHAATAFVVGVVRKFGDDRAGRLAALVAYYGFLSIFPLMLALVTIVGFVLRGDSALARSIKRAATGQLPPPLGDQIVAGTLKGSGLALALGLLGALWAGQGAMNAAQDALNTIWEVPRREQPKALARRARSLLALGVVGLLLVASAVTAQIVAALPANVLSRGALLVATALVTSAVFLASFQILSARQHPWRTLVPGAVLAGIGYVALQQVGRWYVERTVTRAAGTYGTFASVIGLLSWLYLVAQLTVVAVEVNAVLAGRLWPRSLVDRADGS